SDGLVALRALLDYATFRRRRARVPSDDRPRAPYVTLPSNPQVLTEFESKRLLAAAGLPVTREELVHSADGAGAAARRIGFPVALKVQSSDLMHKSAAGALALGLTVDEDVRRTFKHLLADVGSRQPDARIDGVLVQEMVSDGVEVLLGMKRDPSF